MSSKLVALEESISDSSSDDESCAQTRKIDLVTEVKPKLIGDNLQILKSFDCKTNSNAYTSLLHSKVESQYQISLGNVGSTGFNATGCIQKRDTITLKKEETTEQWRNRLWPPKALTSFCRIITRCKPPQLSPHDASKKFFFLFH